jgi:hypothetical protein
MRWRGTTSRIGASLLVSVGGPAVGGTVEIAWPAGATPGRGVFGQTDAESWTVLADLEGNEFCVVRPKRTLVD